jgi:predicted O-methyltransferase YrrM
MNNFTLQDIKLLIDIALQEKPTGNAWLDARYNEQIGIVGHTQPYYRLFYLIAQTLKPRLTVELGCWRGDSSAHFAVGNPEGQVVCVDIHKDSDHAGLASLNEAVAHLPNMSFLQMWSWDAVEPIKALNQPISILFIDAWHDYKYAKLEWDLYSPLLDSPALVICDDITAGYNFDGMLKFWDELPEPKYLSTEGLHKEIPMGFVLVNSKEPTKKKMGRPKKIGVSA